MDDRGGEMDRAFSPRHFAWWLNQAAAELRSWLCLGWDDGAPLALSWSKKSRSQVDRLLDPKSDITLASLQRAAAMVGRRVSIELV